MHKLQPMGPNCYRIPKEGNMRVEARVYLKNEMLPSFEESSARQLMDAASLPGIYKYVIGMPDIHTGFGLPIGGIMAMDAQNGIVSAGAVGMDINCGGRLLKTNIPANQISSSVQRKLLEAITHSVPSGTGKKSKHAGSSGPKLKNILTDGVPVLLQMGIGRSEDLEYIEEQGAFPGGDPAAVSKEALSRADQLSTLGGGNHFIEIGYVAEIFEQNIAHLMGLEEGNLSVLIHTGSRGFGHQICTDYSESMKKTAKRNKIEIPTAGLAGAFIDSKEGKNYLAAMACAANFAFSNRHWITHDIRNAFAEVLGGSDTDYDLGVVYDLAHNIAKFEKLNGKKLLIHRKGATRALPPEHHLNPQKYHSTGHPVIIPGSMGTSSYVVTGTQKTFETFCSVNHGAGRRLSRKAAKKEIPVAEMQEKMEGIITSGKRMQTFLDEAPQAYKNIEQVVDTLSEIDIIRKIARLHPLAVIKGD